MYPNYLFTLLFLLCLTTTPQALAVSTTDPCSGPSALLNIVNRPTVADSACLVPAGKSVLEAGYRYGKPFAPTGHIQDFFEPVFRVGIIQDNEIVAVLPNQFKPSKNPNHGYTATTVGIKHKIASDTDWIVSAEALFTPASGSGSFENNGLNSAFNGILAYNFNSNFSLSFMFGATSINPPAFEVGERFTSINPDLVLTYSATPKLNFYGEIYGQSKTSPTEGSGFSADAGFLYLIRPNMTVDLAYGHHISGNVGVVDRYVGAGMSAMF